jgi:hypothetical protein
MATTGTHSIDACLGEWLIVELSKSDLRLSLWLLLCLTAHCGGDETDAAILAAGLFADLPVHFLAKALAWYVRRRVRGRCASLRCVWCCSVLHRGNESPRSGGRATAGGARYRIVKLQLLLFTAAVLWEARVAYFYRVDSLCCVPDHSLRSRMAQRRMERPGYSFGRPVRVHYVGR